MKKHTSDDRLIRNKDVLILISVVFINLIIKAIPAGLLELGNDEVYYWTYALFPDWSHFDHPPMVGLLIRLFSLNLNLHGELVIRSGALILSSANIVILFYLVKRIYSRLAAYCAVLMYISSFYFNIISGLFILPDTPQIFFILLALSFALPAVTNRNPAMNDSYKMILFGLFAGLAFLSKYHSLFLWFGVGLYILFHNRIWLKKPALYISVLVTLILMIPVLYWNYKNDFISFTFHGSRISLFHNPVNLLSFMRFNLGQFFYQNPVLFIIYTITIIRIIRNIKNEIKDVNLLLLYLGMPLLIIFTALSLFRNTLPHWSGPVFICFIILSSDYLAGIYLKKRGKVIKTLATAAGLWLIVIVAGTLQINNGIIDFKSTSGLEHMGKNDFTLDMYGWKQARQKFEQFLAKEGIPKDDHRQVAILSDNWFPAAHLDYYIANPLKIKLIALGSIEKIHKYYWINQTRKLNNTDRAFYITDSRNYQGPEKFAGCFTEIIPEDTISIYRKSKVVKYIFIYDMVGFKCDSSLNSPYFSLF